MFRETMHLCWRTLEGSLYSAWERLTYPSNIQFEVTISDITSGRQNDPKIHSFSHQEGTAIEKGEEVWFKME
jgi:hypothetical protein